MILESILMALGMAAYIEVADVTGRQTEKGETYSSMEVAGDSKEKTAIHDERRETVRLWPEKAELEWVDETGALIAKELVGAGLEIEMRRGSGGGCSSTNLRARVGVSADGWVVEWAARGQSCNSGPGGSSGVGAMQAGQSTSTVGVPLIGSGETRLVLRKSDNFR